MNTLEMYLHEKLKCKIGNHDLEPRYSIGFSQGDGCAFKGTMNMDDILNVLIHLNDVRSAATVMRWKEYLEWYLEFDSGNRCVSQGAYQSLTSSFGLYNDVDGGDSSSNAIEGRVEVILNDICELVKSVADDCLSDLHSILMNCYGESEPVWSFKTKHFQLKAYERQIDFDYNDLTDHFTFEDMKGLADDQYRAFNLEVRLYECNSDQAAARTMLCGIVENRDTKPGGCHLRDLVSEVISEYRHSNQQIKATSQAA